MPRTGTVLLIAAFALSLNAAAVPSRHRVLRLLETSNYDVISAELRLASENEPAEFAKNNYDYLLARIDEKRGDYASAVQNYHAAAVRDPDLRPYALKHLSQIMRASGNFAFERIFLDEIVYGETKSAFTGAARFRSVRSFYESGDYASVIYLIENAVTPAAEKPSEDSGRELQLLLGNAYLRDKKLSEARELFEKLVESVPNEGQPDDFSLEAVKGLDILNNGDLKLGIEVAGLTAAEHKRRADIYQFNRNFLLARLHYTAIVDNQEADARIPGAMYQIARGYDQERNYAESLSWYQKILNRYPKDAFAVSALYGAAGTYANLDDTGNAVAAYRKYIDENPDARNLERAYLNIVDAYRDAGDNKMALEWSSKIQISFKGKMGEAVALFCDARIHISEEKWDQALPVLSRLREMKDLGGTRIAGGTNNGEVEFLSAFVLEKLDRISEAIEYYLRIRDGRGEYYGWRATERLRRLAASPKYKNTVYLKIEQLEKQKASLRPDEARITEQNIFRLRKSASANDIKSLYHVLNEYSAIPEFDLVKPEQINVTADKLLELGLYDEAAPEIEWSLRENLDQEKDDLADFNDGTAYALAVYHAKGGFADRAIRFVEPKWKKIPKDYQIELIPRSQAVILYPAPFRDELLKYAKKEKIDPRFLLSVMRQESRFQTDIKSASAARGLMQFIYGTSRNIAGELEIEHFSRGDLYDPETAIRFGSRYLANLFKEFPGQHQLVAASYNGGEDRVARWHQRSKSDDPDRYVPEIVFAQTKDYVYKVMANFRMYTYLYDENLVLRIE